MSHRRLEALAVPTGEAVLDLVPRLRAALNGDGPALLPHPAAAAPVPALRPGEPLDAAEDDPADPTVAVLATSGSTGAPKGALLPASALLASASAGHDRLGGPGRWLLALPAEHVAGLQVLLRSLVTGTEPVVLDLADGFRPEAFADAVDRVRGPRRYTALVPTQLRRLVHAGGRPLAALTALDGVLVGGAATAPSLLAEARAAGVTVVTTYGMSETCGGCVYDGRPLDGVRVAVDDTGRIRLGGPVVARGYRGGDPAGVFTTAAPAPGAGRLRWFRTDDLGVVADGTLTVLGRADDVIVSAGLKVSPAVVEAALLGLAGVGEVVVVGVPDPDRGERIVAVVVATGPPPDLEAVRRRVTEQTGRHAAPHQLLVLDRLPLRGPGKPDRSRLRRLAEADHPGPER